MQIINEFRALPTRCRLLFMILITISLGVVGLQQYRVHSIGLSQWKGAGMGMFSDISWRLRVVQISKRTETGYHPVVIVNHSALKKALKEYKIYPSRENRTNILNLLTKSSISFSTDCVTWLKTLSRYRHGLHKSTKCFVATKANGVPESNDKGRMAIQLWIPEYERESKRFSLVQHAEAS